MHPTVLMCDGCGIKVEGNFQVNEFASLAPDDLHFLRIFVRCEGRIREMETALGLSYPTIRTRLTELKNRLVGDHEPEAQPAPNQGTAATTTVQAILNRLQAGELSFDDAMAQIKKLRGNE